MSQGPDNAVGWAVHYERVANQQREHYYDRKRLIAEIRETDPALAQRVEWHYAGTTPQES